VVLAGTTITDPGPTTICGSIGLSPGSATVGLPVLTCGGVTDVDNPAAVAAKVDLSNAYNDALSRTGGVTFAAIYDIGGQTLSRTPSLFSRLGPP
jgi:hypothetical protein